MLLLAAPHLDGDGATTSLDHVLSLFIPTSPIHRYMITNSAITVLRITGISTSDTARFGLTSQLQPPPNTPDETYKLQDRFRRVELSGM